MKKLIYSLCLLAGVVHLQPMHWKDGWPVIGVDMDMNGISEPVEAWRKPNIKKDTPITLPDATKNEYQLLYSYDAKNFTALGDKFPMKFGHWKGVRVDLYCYNIKENFLRRFCISS